MRLPRLTLAGLGIAVVFTGSCSRRPADPVAALLAELESAAETRDADRFGKSLSADFRAEEGFDKPEALRELKRTLAIYETVSISVYGVETERRPAAARVRFVAEFSGDARKLPGLEGFLPPSAVYRFELDVADEAGTWRVRQAGWQAVPDQPPSPPSR